MKQSEHPIHTNSKRAPKWDIRRIALVGVMSAVISLLGPLVLPLPFSPIPVSLATLGIYFAAYALGAYNGVLRSYFLRTNKPLKNQTKQLKTFVFPCILVRVK